MRRRRGAFAAAMLLVACITVPALGSSVSEPVPNYVETRGGTDAERVRLYDGRAGLVMARAPAPMLYLHWRLLHGLEVGLEAGEDLSIPCCGPLPEPSPGGGVYGWLEARSVVPGVPESLSYVPTERPGPDYTTIPNCFSDAFDTATSTLRDRAARYGPASPAVKAWLLAQDAVFDACANPGAVLPPVMADAPEWLRADRAYQEAAFALYQGRNDEAADRFAAISSDRASPWRPMGLYLKARAWQREALANPSPQNFARSRRVLAELAAAPAGTYGVSQLRRMQRALAYRDQSAELLAELDLELNRHEAAPDLAISLHDYLTLSDAAPTRPDAADWIRTLQASARETALGHARERWRETRDAAWLVAALSLVNPDEEAAATLAEDAARVGTADPAWLTAQYHRIRLTIGKADAAAMRGQLDAILSRPDLTIAERNLFLGARTQVATDLVELARFALRRPYCASGNPAFCVQDGWAATDGSLGRRDGTGEFVGFGPDARALIDRLPLADRIALSRNPQLPDELRFDLALTGFARAVQLQDDAAVDALATDLATRLPQLREEMRAIAAAPPGPAKRFAEFFVMAKLPGLRTDLVEYVRPLGTLADFQGYWVDWLIVPREAGTGPGQNPRAAGYLLDSYWYGDDESRADFTCLGECGAGAFPLHLPDFVASKQEAATAERRFLVTGMADEQDVPRALPTGTVSAWDEALAYAQAHPDDPRAPELCYWLIRVARWGGSHNQSGRRAFAFLHRRYPNSSWARRSPYYYD